MTIQLTRSDKQKLWNQVLAGTCHCRPDSVGNVPCDYGFPCSRCEDSWVQEIYQAHLAGLIADGEPVKPGDTVTAHGLTFKIGQLIYQEHWLDTTSRHMQVLHDIEFLDTDGGYHHWKSAWDGGHINRKEVE